MIYGGSVADIVAAAALVLAVGAQRVQHEGLLPLALLDHVEVLTGGDRANFGVRIAEQLLAENLDEIEGLQSVLLGVLAVGSPTGLPIMRRMNYDRFVRPFADWLGGEDAQIRAYFISSLMSGVVVNRSVAADSSTAGLGDWYGVRSIPSGNVVTFSGIRFSRLEPSA